ncbi:hypothetical protein MSSIT_2492 [Methanosarcina siciliae T4/M]|uniref:Uncharacterized protein n=2 Tax=Methanosarcina siciliae TaxID=38027 RepID=A0A0E3PET2_9EURY|nr:hypothetical protein MSSIT_2492 [Methanosarcina siciliae T4/M]AKB33108.1 hypothetical protein MSSIH_2418 [Methanosarcina siciliae HI350]
MKLIFQFDCVSPVHLLQLQIQLLRKYPSGAFIRNRINLSAALYSRTLMIIPHSFVPFAPVIEYTIISVIILN